MSNPYSSVGTNSGYIASDRGNEDLLTGYSRNIGSFRLPQYCPIKPVARQRGLYQKFNPNVNFRMGSNWKAESVWADGADRPNGLKNKQELVFEPYQTVRYDEPILATDLEIQQADWAVTDTNAQTVLQLMMTRRTAFAMDALSTAVYGGNTAPVDSSQAGSIVSSRFTGAVAGSNWSNGTTIQPNIKASIQFGLKQIQVATGAAVGLNELCLVIGPDVAMAMSTSAEVTQALIQSVYAAQLVTGTDGPEAVIAPYNAMWGLPYAIGGVPIVVEDAVWDITGKPGTNGAGVGTFIMDANTAYLLRRPRNILQNIELPKDVLTETREAYFPVVSSLVMIAREEMSLESFDEPRNRRQDTHVVTDFQIQLVSALSAFKYTHVVS